VTTPNIELLDQAIAWAEHSESLPQDAGVPRWDQAHYMAKADCGTTCCIAGWVALHEGAKPILDSDGDPDSLEVIDTDGHRQDIPVVARRALGLTSDQSGYLFWGSNTLEDLKRMRDNLAAGRDITHGFAEAA